jgi:hypothetical protein
MDEFMRCGADAETKKGDPLLGVKKTMLVIHTFVKLHGSPPQLQNGDRESSVK